MVCCSTSCDVLDRSTKASQRECSPSCLDPASVRGWFCGDAGAERQVAGVSVVFGIDVGSRRL